MLFHFIYEYVCKLLFSTTECKENADEIGSHLYGCSTPHAMGAIGEDLNLL